MVNKNYIFTSACVRMAVILDLHPKSFESFSTMQFRTFSGVGRGLNFMSAFYFVLILLEALFKILYSNFYHTLVYLHFS